MFFYVTNIVRLYIYFLSQYLLSADTVCYKIDLFIALVQNTERIGKMAKIPEGFYGVGQLLLTKLKEDMITVEKAFR